MATQAQIAANRQNSLKSTGPKTPEGRSKSSINALKHGMRSRKLALLRDESIAFENRRLKWMANADAQDDIEEFLIYQNVSLSFELERVDQARHERIIAEIESSDDDDFVAVHQLGKRLFFDPGGPTPMYGNRPEFDPRPRTSWNGRAVDPDDPFVVNNAQPHECEQPVACGALPDRGPESEPGQRTNEPDFAENMSVVQNQECVGVAARVGVESALDKQVSGPLSVVRC